MVSCQLKTHHEAKSLALTYDAAELALLFLVNPTPSPTPSAIPKTTSAINAISSQKTAPRRLFFCGSSGSFAPSAPAPASPRSVALSPGFPASFNVSSSLLNPGDPGKLPSRAPVSGASELSFLFSSRSLIPGDPGCRSR